MLTVAELYIYPIKSLGGISVNSAKALKAGFEYDRRWMLIDERNAFITQRNIPQLVLFQPIIVGQYLCIQYENDLLSIGLDEETGEQIATNVWQDNCLTMAVSKMADEWFCDKLRKKVRLVKLYSESSRWHHNKDRNMVLNVSLADGYPYLAVGTASLGLLNSLLSIPVGINRFRPNIVINTDTAHIEDHWESCAVGNVLFQNMKPCERCNVITIDPDDASASNEILRVLNTYRKLGNHVIFGTNMMCETEGIITVGDKFTQN